MTPPEWLVAAGTVAFGAALAGLGVLWRRLADAASARTADRWRQDITTCLPPQPLYDWKEHGL